MTVGLHFFTPCLNSTEQLLHLHHLVRLYCFLEHTCPNRQVEANTSRKVPPGLVKHCTMFSRLTKMYIRQTYHRRKKSDASEPSTTNFPCHPNSKAVIRKNCSSRSYVWQNTIAHFAFTPCINNSRIKGQRTCMGPEDSIGRIE